MPDAEIAWRDVWLGAAITSLLFNLGKSLIGLYLARSNLATTYGAAASVVLIFVWVYYTAQILLLGAEFTQVYATRFGQGIRPEPHAELITEQERLQQGLARKQG
jgi:membrane protein